MGYKEAFNSICTYEEASFSPNTDQWDCTSSTFCNPHHKHIITEDYKMIKSNKLKKIDKDAYLYFLKKNFFKISNMINFCIGNTKTEDKTNI